MSRARRIASLLQEDCGAARGHFEAWWTLRNVAIPEFVGTMGNYGHVDFFQFTAAAHYKCVFLALGRIFDRDVRAAGFLELKKALQEEQLEKTLALVTTTLEPYVPVIGRIVAIRSKAIAHGEHATPRDKVYETYGVTPDEIRSVIDAACDTVNAAQNQLGSSNGISDGSRMRKATLHMLQHLRTGLRRPGTDAPESESVLP